MSPHSGMHMESHGSGSIPSIPWLTYPIMLHSSRENECTLTPEQCAYQKVPWRFWYQADHVYALSAVYFSIAMILLFTIVHFGKLVLHKRLNKNSATWRRAAASFRYLAYRGFRIEILQWNSPPLGVILLGLAGLIFFTGIALGPQPYYWPNLDWGHSPPLATRSGWLALGIFPFVVALPSKLNLISQLTSISHEKLQVFHRWSAWMMFVLALLHTFPFIVLNTRIGEIQTEWKTSVYYWTGVAALVPQGYLTLFSVGPIRHRFYEFFKYTHLMSAVVFVVFFFIHCGFTLTSVDYFIAAGVIYFLPLMFSLLRTGLEYGIIRKAQLQALPDGNIRVTIPTDTAEWIPGQHVFIRFLAFGVHCFTKHPFTVTSLPDSGELAFYLGAKDGITRVLRKRAETHPERHIRVLLDGPYGGMQATRLSCGFKKVLILAGGSGASFTLPLIEDILQREALGENQELDGWLTGKIRHHTQLRIVFASRSKDTYNWYRDEVEKLMSKYCHPVTCVEAPLVEVHITSTGLVLDQEQSSNPEESAVTNSMSKGGDYRTTITQPASTSQKSGRPNLPRIIRETTAEAGGSVGIAVCGPSTMISDVRDAAAEAQLRIMTGHGNAPNEVYLHTENFSW